MAKKHLPTHCAPSEAGVTSRLPRRMITGVHYQPLALFSFPLLHSKPLPTEELRAPAAFLLQGFGVTWLCLENASSRRVAAGSTRAPAGTRQNMV